VVEVSKYRFYSKSTHIGDAETLRNAQSFSFKIIKELQVNSQAKREKLKQTNVQIWKVRNDNKIS